LREEVARRSASDGGRVRGHIIKQCVQNRFKHAVGVAHDAIVPETQHSISMIVQPSISNRILLAVRMLASIQLNDQSAFTANEINNVWTDCLLSHELKPA
jgi:hypothetical protein